MLINQRQSLAVLGAASLLFGRRARWHRVRRHPRYRFSYGESLNRRCMATAQRGRRPTTVVPARWSASTARSN